MDSRGEQVGVVVPWSPFLEWGPGDKLTSRNAISAFEVCIKHGFEECLCLCLCCTLRSAWFETKLKVGGDGGAEESD